MINENIYNRINDLINECKNVKSYDYVVDEVEHLIISFLGKESSEYQKFLYVKKYYWFKSDKLPRFIGLLNCIKNKLLEKSLNQINKNNLRSDIKLHSSIILNSFDKYVDGYYSEAVESAIKIINSRLKNLYKKYKGCELDGNKLFNHVFNSDKEIALFIAGKDLETQSGKDEQEGYKLLLMGIWYAFRNPSAHSNIETTKENSLERLMLCSMIMNKIDECVKKAGLKE